MSWQFLDTWDMLMQVHSDNYRLQQSARIDLLLQKLEVLERPAGVDMDTPVLQVLPLRSVTASFSLTSQAQFSETQLNQVQNNTCSVVLVIRIHRLLGFGLVPTYEGVRDRCFDIQHTVSLWCIMLSVYSHSGCTFVSATQS